MASLPAPLRELLDLPDAERKIGPFALERQLGRGGFAPVWLAKEVYGDKELRTAAVKLFALDAGAEKNGASSGSARGVSQHRDAVIEEARSLCRVEHPNIVRFFALPIDAARGVVGLAMEYVAGTPLDERIRAEKRLRVKDTLDVGIAVARALAAVHKAGLVHRDVKPANVVESNGVYKLIDFGIASADAPEAKPRARTKRVVLDDLPLELVGTKMSMLASAYTVDRDGAPTGPFVASGTVGYIDPECVGNASAAVASSDLYGLGAMLFECLTGEIPAHAAQPPGTGLRGEVLDGRAGPPSVRDVADEVPEALRAIVDALLEPSRARRPASAEAVAETLEGVRRALDAPHGTSRRGPWWRPALAVGALAVAAGVGALVVGRSREAPQSARKVAAPPSAPTGRDCALGDLTGCADSCEGGSAVSCATLAQMYRSGSGVPRDVARAKTLFDKACHGGNQLGCYELGTLHEASLDYSAAYDVYTKACEGGNAQACNAAGALLWSGTGPKKDPVAAVAFFRRACDAKYAGACASLGAAYDRGLGVAVDPEAAARIYELACTDGALSACSNFATLLASGRGVAKDVGRAASLYAKACDGDYADACQGLGVLTESGDGVAKDAKRAIELYDTACTKKAWGACVNLGLLRSSDDTAVRNEGLAFIAFSRACEAKQAVGCRLLAGFYAAGKTVVKDEAQARVLAKQACNLGDADACAGIFARGDAGQDPAPARPAPPAARPRATGALPTAKPKINCSPNDPLCGGF